MPNGQNQKRINYALAATLLMVGKTLAEVCAEVGAKNENSLRVGLWKRGVTCGKARALQSATNAATPSATAAPGRTMTVTARVATEASAIVSESGRKLRQSLASVSEASAGVLDAKPAKTVAEVIQRASALKSLVDAGDKLHGWSAQASAPAWNVTILDRSAPSCVSDTPSGSMPAQIADSTTPQVEQVTDIQEVASVPV